MEGQNDISFNLTFGLFAKNKNEFKKTDPHIYTLALYQNKIHDTKTVKNIQEIVEPSLKKT